MYVMLLGRLWQHDVDGTHKGKKDIYIFKWKSRKIALKPIGGQTETFKVDKDYFCQSATLVYSW